MKLAKKRKDAPKVRRFTDMNGKRINLIFRDPMISDAKAAMNFINKLVDEKSYVALQKKIKITEENKGLKATMEKIKKKEMTRLFAIHNNEIIGSCGVEKCDTTASHTGKIGIAIAKNYRRIGLGKFMMSCIIKEAQKTLKSEIIILHVYSKNKPAQKLYKKLGFKVAGSVPRGIKHHGKYMDDILMYKKL